MSFSVPQNEWSPVSAPQHLWKFFKDSQFLGFLPTCFLIFISSWHPSPCGQTCHSLWRAHLGPLSSFMPLRALFSQNYYLLPILTDVFKEEWCGGRGCSERNTITVISTQNTKYPETISGITIPGVYGPFPTIENFSLLVLCHILRLLSSVTLLALLSPCFSGCWLIYLLLSSKFLLEIQLCSAFSPFLSHAFSLRRRQQGLL